MNTEFTAEERLRYSRHLIMPELGAEGQARLKNARVLCIGAGGLGSPAALYLTAAGVGTIGIVDSDKVDLSNLQRQILHRTTDVGRPKVTSAGETLRALNPGVRLQLHQCDFRSDNAMELVADYDIVIDGSDNFATRYLSNDVCVFTGKPNVYGSVFRFDGQASVFAPHLGSGCYRCMFPQPPPPGTVPSCAEAGVLGVLPGIIGTMQALEAIKLILGFGETLLGRLLHFDAARMRFREFKLRRDPACPVCGENPTITAAIDYERFCSGETAEPKSMSVHELKQKLATNSVAVVDVREPWEHDIAQLSAATLIPLGDLPDRVDELPRDRDLALLCRSGVRSAMAVQFLEGAGFSRAYNVEGGILAWAEEIDPSLPRY